MDKSGDFFTVLRKSNSPTSNIIWTQEQIDYIIAQYNLHHSTTRIAKDFNLTNAGSIRTVLKKYGNGVLNLSDLHKIGYPRNSDYFENIDTPEKAYWLGFLFADGCVDKKNSIKLGLASVDEEHVKKFQKAIGAVNYKIIHSQKSVGDKIYYQSILTIRDYKMVNDLAKLGCVNNKSLILEFPTEKIPEGLYSHFIRGYFDGDGSLNYTKKIYQGRQHHWRIEFCGTKNFLEKLKRIFGKENLALENRGKYYCLTIGGAKQLERILAYIYKDAYDEICLSRKKEKYELFIQERIKGEPVNSGCESN